MRHEFCFPQNIFLGFSLQCIMPTDNFCMCVQGYVATTPSVAGDFSTTATYSGPITIALGFPPDSLSSLIPQILQQTASGWKALPTTYDPQSNMVYATVTSLSAFALGWPQASYTVQPGTTRAVVIDSGTGALPAGGGLTFDTIVTAGTISVLGLASDPGVRLSM